jgi:hypothetical protein
MSLARQLAMILCAALPLAAAPALTTIQDTIYKADGTRFNGTAVISWSTFDANDTSHIGMQSVTVQIVNGAIRVQLVPNSNATPPNLYTVQYSSDGMQQYTETWSVPPSTTPLRISAVNVTASTATAAGATGGGVTSGSACNPIVEACVTGLQTDLSLRPVKGSLYSNNGAAMIDSTGAIDAVQGNLSDCVHVDGTSGGCIDPGTVISNETPGGGVDGSNTTFTLANTVSPAGSLMLYRNGLLLQSAIDYNLSGSTITFVAAATPQPGDILLASYQDSVSSFVMSPAAVQFAPSVSLNSTPQVLCSAGGSSTSSTTTVSLGSCAIPANTLSAGDRVEVRFSLSHQGTASGFVFSVLWGSAVMVQRTASSSDALVAGHGDASLSATGVDLDVETWGSVLPLANGVAAASNSSSVMISFQGALSTAGTDSVALQNYTVIRYPAY